MRFPVNPISMLRVLCVVIMLDIVTTVIGVGLLGATELNPFSDMMGFPLFMIMKAVVSLVCIYMIHKYSIPLCPKVAAYGTCFAAVLYGAVCASNVHHLVGAVV